jgi:hypothetical protein
MQLTKAIQAALLTLVPLVTAVNQMQYAVMNTPDGIAQKVAFLTGTVACTALVPVLAEGGQNACDVPFTFSSRAPGYTFTFINCNAAGVPQALDVAPDGQPTTQTNGNGFTESINCGKGHQFTTGEIENVYNLPF